MERAARVRRECIVARVAQREGIFELTVPAGSPAPILTAAASDSSVDAARRYVDSLWGAIRHPQAGKPDTSLILLKDEKTTVPFTDDLDLTDAKAVCSETGDGRALFYTLPADTDEEAQRLIAGLGQPSIITQRPPETEGAPWLMVLIYLFTEPADEATRAMIDDADGGLSGLPVLDHASPIPNLCDADYARESDEKAVDSMQPLARVDAKDFAGKLAAFAKAEPSTAEAEPAPPVKFDPTRWSNVELIGGDLSTDLLSTPMALAMPKFRDDKRVKNYEDTFGAFLDKLCDHKVGPKDGLAWLQGTLNVDRKKGGPRNKGAMLDMFVMGLDIDTGAEIEPIIEAVRKLNLACVAYSTNSHMGTESTFLVDPMWSYATKHNLDLAATEDLIRHYVTHEKHWESWVIDTIRFVAQRQAEQDKDGPVYVIEHAPMPKHRLAFLLKSAVTFNVRGARPEDLRKQWGKKIQALATKIGAPIDMACLDVSRLFYFGRHKQDAPFRVIVVNGEALDYDAIDVASDEDDPFAVAGRDMGARDSGSNSAAAFKDDSVPGFSFKRWASLRAHRIDYVRLLIDKCPDRIRNECSDDKIEIECVFDSLHSNAGNTEDRACCVWNPDLTAENPGFGISCRHTGCQPQGKSRDRLAFACEMVTQDWLTIDDLEDDNYILDLKDGETIPSAKIVDLAARATEVAEKVLTRVEDEVFGKTASFRERAAAVQEAAEARCDDVEMAPIIAAVVTTRANIKFSKTDAKNIVERVRRRLAVEEETRERKKVEDRQKREEANEDENGFILPDPWVRAGDLIGKESKERGFIPYCSNFKILNQASSQDFTARSMLIEFKHPEGQRVQFEIDMTQLHCGPVALCGELVGRGFWIEAKEDTRKGVITLLSNLHAKNQHLCATKAGWHVWRDEKIYLSPAGDAWDIKGERHDVRLADSQRIAGRKGSLDGWKEAAALASRRNWYWTLGITSGFSGTLAALCGAPTTGLMLVGPSGAGKTTGCMVGAAAWGNPDIRTSEGLIFSLKSTATALEILAMRGNGASVVFDEVKQAEKRELSSILFMLTGGVGKNRSNQNLGLRENSNWMSNFMLTSEHTLPDVLESIGEDMDPGEAVRLPNVILSPRDVVSVDSAEMEKIDLYGVREHYGYAGPVFVEQLFRDGYVTDPARLHDEIEAASRAIDGRDGEEVTGQELRAARAFGIRLVAGEIAIRAGLLPPDTDIGGAIRKAWRRYRDGVGGQILKPNEVIIEKMLKSYAQTRQSHFFDLESDTPGQGLEAKYGYRDSKCLYLFESSLVKMVGNGQTFEAIFDALRDAGFVNMRGKNRFFAKIPKGKQAAQADGDGEKGINVKHIRLYLSKFVDGESQTPF